MSLIDKLKIRNFRKVRAEVERLDWDRLLAELLGLSKDEWDNWDIDDWNIKIKELKEEHAEDFNFEYLIINDEKYWFYPPNLWTLSEYIDARTFINRLDFHLFVSIFFRQKENNSVKQWGSFKLKADEFDDISIKYFFQCQKSFNKFEEQIKKGFPMLFTENVEDEEDLSQIKDKRQMMQIKIERIKKEQLKQESWNSIIWGLCNGDITKWNDILRTPYLRILTVLKLEKIRD